MDKVNLAEKLRLFDELWKPRIVGEVGGLHVKLVKLKGEFVWHKHDAEDELFLVLKGRLKLEFRDRTLVLSQGEMCVVPKGVEHKSSADVETHVFLVEPPTTVNTGNVRDEHTLHRLERL
ncbi:MAG: cupin domain-containing protein [Planctomycetota bacterium]